MSGAYDDLDWPGYAEEMGRRLAAVRRARHVSQESLAHAAGLSRNQVQNIEQNRSSGEDSSGNTTMRTLIALARALGVPPMLLVPSAEVVPTTRNPQVDAGWATLEVELTQSAHRWPLPPSTRTSPRVG